MIKKLLFVLLLIPAFIFSFAACSEDDVTGGGTGDVKMTGEADPVLDYTPPFNDARTPIKGTGETQRTKSVLDLNEKSENGWEILGPGGGGFMFSPSICPHDNNSMMVSCDMGGSYMSQDGGESWAWGAFGGAAYQILYDPYIKGRVYLCSGNSLWRSENNGSEWTIVYSADGGITAVAVDPADPGHIYVALQNTAFSGVHHSTDDGASWHMLADTSGAAYANVQNITSYYVRFFIDHNLFPGKLFMFSASGMAKIDITSGAADAVDKPEADYFTWGYDKEGKPYFYITSMDSKIIYLSHDLEKWTELPDTPAAVRVMETCFSDPSVIYMSAGGRVYKSTDYGENWEWQLDFNSAGGSGLGMPPMDKRGWMVVWFGAYWEGAPTMISVAANDPGVAVFTTYGTAWKTFDGGGQWYPAYTVYDDGGYRSTGLDVTTGYKAVVNPFDPDEINLCYTDIGLFVSTNGGRSWRDGKKGIPKTSTNTCYDLIYDPKVPGKVWSIWAQKHDMPWRVDYMLEECTGHVGRSENGPLEWINSSSGLPAKSFTPYSLVLDPQSPPGKRTLYISAPGWGVYKSVDDGITWALVGEISKFSPENNRAIKLAINENGRLFLIVDLLGDEPYALYYSDDGGYTWENIPTPPGVSRTVEIQHDPVNPDGLYIGSIQGTGGLWYSADLGANWECLSDSAKNVSGFEIDQANPDRIVLALQGENYAVITEDMGKTWYMIDGYVSYMGIHAFWDIRDPNKAFITGPGNGFWHGPVGPGVIRHATTPRITTDLKDITVVQGSALVLTGAAVAGENASLSYRWYKTDNKSAFGGTAVFADAVFTVPTGTAGKYYFYLEAQNTDDGENINGRTISAAARAFEVNIVTQDEYDRIRIKNEGGSSVTDPNPAPISAFDPSGPHESVALKAGIYEFTDPHSYLWDEFGDVDTYGIYGTLDKLGASYTDENGLRVIRLLIGEYNGDNPTKLMLGDKNPGNNKIFGQYGSAVTYKFDYPVSYFNVGPIQTYLFAAPKAILHREPLDYMSGEKALDDYLVLDLDGSPSTFDIDPGEGYTYVTIIGPFGPKESWDDVVSIGQVDIKVVAE